MKTGILFVIASSLSLMTAIAMPILTLIYPDEKPPLGLVIRIIITVAVGLFLLPRGLLMIRTHKEKKDNNEKAS